MTEKSERSASMEVSTTFAQVVFQNIPHSYTPNVPVTCCYTLTSAIQPNPRDWVGIFKVGWSNTKDYHTFVWVEPSVGLEGQEPVMKQVIFTTYYLPKDDAEFYQFCYVDSTGLVRGASTPFCFKTPEEQSTDSLENDLLIITTQEKVDQREREQEELVRELRQQTELNETLRSTLKEQQQEIHRLKLSNEGSYQANWNLEKHPQNARDLVKLTQNSKPMGASSKGLEDNVEKGERERAELAMELQQLKEQNEALKCALMEQQSKVCCLKENVEKNEREKAELVMELKEQKEQNQTLTSALQEQQDKWLQYPICEKYEQALIKIKQLKKEREELRGKVEVQSVEIAQLSPRLKESEQESHRLKCQFQLLQVQCPEQTKKSMTTSSEKYDQALTKIKQLKSERGELKRKVEELSEEIAQLSPRLRESEQESSRLKDHIQILQVDLQSTEKEKLSTELRGMGSLTHNLEDLKTENKALRRSLSEQGQQHHLPDEKVDSEMKKYKAYISQLHEANTKLQQERQASIHIRKWAEHAEAELKELKEQKEQNQTLTSALQEQQDKWLQYPICEKYEQALIKIKQLKKEREELRGKVEVQSVEIAQLSPRLKESEQESHRLKCQFQLLQSMTTSSEKYDQALTKIKQLKSERGELKRKVEELSEEIAQLSPRLRESEQESSRLKDHIQLLQVDLQSTEKEKEKLSTELRGMGSLTHNLEDLKTENKALRRSLSEQGQQHHLPDEKVDSEMKKYQAYISQLHEANTKLQQERQASIHIRKWAEHAEAELKELKEQMESTVKASTQMKMKNSKLEMKLTELHGIIQEKENMTEMAEVEKVELSRENQDLKRDIEKLRREVADLQAAQVSAHYSNPYSSSTDPNPTAVQHQDTQANTLYFGNPYETPGTATNPHQDELSLECRHCHECFPGITQDELEQHELSHRVCPFCTLICDNMEQTSYEDHVYSHEV